MNKSANCENRDPVLSINRFEPSIKRSEDEVRYGRLWAEVELPKLLAKKESDK
jgi:hypothetical protein